MEVYVDSNTRLLNALAGGSTLRFYGLVFNYNGTLRMDCAQGNDGVAFITQPSAAQQANTVKGDVQAIRRQTPDSLERTVNVVRQP